jgi:hypothetical protein
MSFCQPTGLKLIERTTIIFISRKVTYVFLLLILIHILCSHDLVAFDALLSIDVPCSICNALGGAQRGVIRPGFCLRWRKNRWLLCFHVDKLLLSLRTMIGAAAGSANSNGAHETKSGPRTRYSKFFLNQQNIRKKLVDGWFIQILSLNA